MRRSFGSRVFAFVAAFILLVSSVPPVSVHAVGEWANVCLVQRSVDHWQGCTVCTLQLMMQNSDTLKPEWQFSAGVIPSSKYQDGSKYDKFNQQCSSNIANGIGDNVAAAKNAGYGSKHVSDSVRPANMNALAQKVCRDGITWTHFASESSVSDGTNSNSVTMKSSVVIGLGGKNFKSMSQSEVISAMKLYWNAGYWVAVGLTYSSGGSQLGPGPDGNRSDHWVMLAGVDDSNFYINDPAYGKVGGFFNNSNWPKYDKVVHLAIFKNNYKSPLELSGGERANLNQTDYGNLNGMGITQDVANSVRPTLNMSFSDDVLLANSRLAEANLSALTDIATTDNLAQDDLEVLEGWRDNIDGNKNENGFIAVLRWLVQAVGILITIWALLIYMAFWFDHINSFVYLDVLHILTLGQLHICPPGEKPTFALGKGKNDRTVSHWQIVCICLTAILFGAMLISGVFYSLVTKLIRIVTGFVWGS